MPTDPRQVPSLIRIRAGSEVTPGLREEREMIVPGVVNHEIVVLDFT